ncbi:Gfo/Idh/MocA family protein [Frondihabitans australicus]|uniref:Putative dehydrogenase n=1 Tax=Frondihabitans australicus TaxID=386892 RepID=A0A495IF07_9MICO|nr:Gfo/Idh/MocA family oxidoreductase [Frondihabitans australicus]RKR74349.1 putative dehydrogenase [Frondihabitans australicus]
MSTPTLHVAVVGCGVIGRHHARVITAHEGLTVTAAVDAVLPAATALADEAQAAGVARPAVAATLEAALDEAEVDLVVICSPSGLHVQLAETALAAGRHVVIEKPLDVSVARARQIAGLARDAATRGLVVSVISQHRFDPANALVARAAHDGTFGRVTSGVASIGWWRSQDYYDSGEWRGTWALDGGGAVMNQGVHTVDLLVWMLGRPVEITAQTGLVAHERVEVEDVAVATIRFESGALAVVHATTAAYPGDLTRIQVHGDRGTGVVTDDRLEYFHAAPRDVEMGIQGSLDKANQAAGLLPDDQMVGGPAEADHFLRGHSRQYDDIVAAIREGRAPGVTVDDALLSLATVKSIYVAATLGRPVRVDDVLTGVLDDQAVTVGAHA